MRRAKKNKYIIFLAVFAVFIVLHELLPTLGFRRIFNYPLGTHVKLNSNKAESTTSGSSSSSSALDELTTVTAFFNIEEYQTNRLKPDFSKEQMRIFGLIESPVVGYFDTDEYMDLFVQTRKHLPSHLTVARKVNTSQMWSFGLVPEIENIFKKPGYPKHEPQTVVPRYVATMHAKYEVLHSAVTENPFKTRYFCWVDAGYFGDLPMDSPKFSLYLPPDFNIASVAYLQPYGARDTAVTVADIVKDNRMWVAGGFFIAESSVMHRWADEYKGFVQQMVKDGWMGVDYHVIYAGFNTMNPKTNIQTYNASGFDWFYLGNLARDAGLKRRPVT